MMPINIGLDTSFIIGLLDDQDLWHSSASELQIALEAGNFRPFVFDCVLAEVISTLARRTHEKRRQADLKALLTQIRSEFPRNSITWISPDLPDLYDEVVALVEETAGELNFNDALIALSCRNRRVSFLVSFDADFDQVPWLKRIARPGDFSN